MSLIDNRAVPSDSNASIKWLFKTQHCVTIYAIYVRLLAISILIAQTVLGTLGVCMCEHTCKCVWVHTHTTLCGAHEPSYSSCAFEHWWIFILNACYHSCSNITLHRAEIIALSTNRYLGVLIDCFCLKDNTLVGINISESSESLPYVICKSLLENCCFVLLFIRCHLDMSFSTVLLLRTLLVTC